MALFEGYERRIDGINEVCKKYDIPSIEAAADICKEKGRSEEHTSELQSQR